MSVYDTIRSQVLKNLDVTQEEFDSWATKEYSIHGSEERFKEMVLAADKIRIFGDYDVDGICATKIMDDLVCYLTGEHGHNHLPRRFSEGYGMKTKQIEDAYEEDKELLAQGKNILIITVDNGIAAYEPVKRAKELGYNVCVTDHHELADITKIPPADLVLDPKVSGCGEFDCEHYCGAGVAYKLAENLIDNPEFVRELRAYAGLATVADVMKLREDNHHIVRTCIDEMRHGFIPKPLQLLADEKGFNFEVLTEKDFGFLFGPMFNASGRLYDDGAEYIYNFLMNPTAEVAKEIVKRNEDRKEIVKDETETVMATITDAEHKHPIIAYVPNLHEGVVGILAGNITEELGVPTIVLTSTENPDIVKGSARSVPGFSIFEHLCEINLNHPEVYAGFGGHDGAAGLSIHKKYLKDFVKANQETKEADFTRDTEKKPIIQISKDQIPLVYEVLREYAPFGEGNPEITFRALFHTFYDRAFWIGKDKTTLSINKGDYKVVAFHVKDDMPKGNMFWLTGSLELSSYQGKTDITFRGEEVSGYEKKKEKLKPVVVVSEQDDLEPCYEE